MNLTDPDSHTMKGQHQYVQGYNTQAVVTEDQIVLAAEITVEAVDFSQLRPMLTAAVGELQHAGVSSTPEVVIADAGYWNEQHMDDVTADHGIQVLIPPDSRNRDGERPGWTGGRYSWMRAVLATPIGEWLYRKRQPMIEPVFGHTKHNRKYDQFHRRGRAAVRTEWRLNHDDSQPHQAPPPPDSHRRALRGPEAADPRHILPSEQQPSPDPTTTAAGTHRLDGPLRDGLIMRDSGKLANISADGRLPLVAKRSDVRRLVGLQGEGDGAG